MDSLCNYIFSEFSEAAAVSRGEANTCGLLERKPVSFPLGHHFHGKYERFNRGREEGGEELKVQALFTEAAGIGETTRFDVARHS